MLERRGSTDQIPEEDQDADGDDPDVEPKEDEKDPGTWRAIRPLPPPHVLIALIKQEGKAEEKERAVRDLIWQIAPADIVDLVNQRDSKGLPPLFHAVERKDQLKCVDTLLAYGASVNMLDYGGDMPLHRACSFGERSIIKSLVMNGAKIDAKNGNGTFPYQCVTDDSQQGAMQQYLADLEDQYVAFLEDKTILKDTPHEKAHFKVIFDTIDRDGKGFINMNDVMPLLAEMDEDKEAVKLPDTDTVKQFYSWIDVRERGTISFPDFLRGMIFFFQQKAKYIKKFSKRRGRGRGRARSPTARGASAKGRGITPRR